MPPETDATIIALLERIAAALDLSGTEGLSPKESAAFVGVSVSLWHSMNSRGSCPAPAQLSERLPRWSRTELRAWLLAGAPSRRVWDASREIHLRRAG